VASPSCGDDAPSPSARMAITALPLHGGPEYQQSCHGPQSSHCVDLDLDDRDELESMDDMDTILDSITQEVTAEVFGRALQRPALALAGVGGIWEGHVDANRHTTALLGDSGTLGCNPARVGCSEVVGAYPGEEDQVWPTSSSTGLDIGRTGPVIKVRRVPSVPCAPPSGIHGTVASVVDMKHGNMSTLIYS
jgi:hypothetical protein